MSQKQRDKQQRREARRQKGGLSPAERQAAYEARCVKRKAQELQAKQFAEAERVHQREAAQKREAALADAIATATIPAEGGELRLVGLHEPRQYLYPAIVKINGLDFIVSAACNRDGDTWLSLKPKPQPPQLDRATPARHRGRLSPYRNNLALATMLMAYVGDRK